MSAFIISLPALERNALILRDVADAAGCRIALALKGFSCWPCFEALSPWLDGCCASGLWEARLAQVREACADLFSRPCPGGNSGAGGDFQPS